MPSCDAVRTVARPCTYTAFTYLRLQGQYAMAQSESDRADHPTTPDGEPTTRDRAPDPIRHGEAVVVSNDEKEAVAVLDRVSYRRPALTVPESDTILYLDEMNADTRLRVAGERYPDYDHRETVDNGVSWP